MATPDMMAQGGPPPSIDLPAPPGGDQAAPPEDTPMDIEEAAKQALQMLNSALSQPGVDPEDANFAEAATSALTKIIATNQKNSDAAMGIGPAHKAVRKIASKSGSGGDSGGY